MISVYDLLYYQTIYDPKGVALVHNNCTVNYRQLGEMILDTAASLRILGVSEGSLVGYLYGNNPACVALFYAIQKIGAIAVPFNNRYLAEEITLLLQTVRCELFIFEESYSNLIDSVVKASGEGTRFVTRGQLPSGHVEEAASSCPAAKEPALLLFTGGTTGKPKAAIISREGLYLKATLHLLDVNDFNKTTVMLCYSPLFHVAGFTYLLYLMSLGATLVLNDGFDVVNMLKTIETFKVTHIFLIPPGIGRQIQDSPLFYTTDLSSIRFVIMSGGTSAVDIVGQAFHMFPGTLISNTFGHTESAVDLLLVYSEEEFRANPEICRSVGKMSKGSIVELRDENGIVVPCGEPGEAWAKAPGMLLGFWGTESPIVEGWYATGDILRQDENGYFYFMDRKKDMIKSGGENVYSGEVENVLKSHPAVEDCAVFGLPDPKWSETVTAAIVLKSGAHVKVKEEEIIAHCRERLASYKKPTRVFFVDKLPKTSIGKVQKNILRSRYAPQ
jgi:long-chain acyl-CoA synthetase